MYKRAGETGNSFNGHPPLGVNATGILRAASGAFEYRFQWAPTLGGECYYLTYDEAVAEIKCFNGHPPLGVNATWF